MTPATSPGAVGGEGRRARVTHYLTRQRTTRQALDDALAQIGACVLVVAGLRVADYFHLLNGVAN